MEKQIHKVRGSAEALTNIINIINNSPSKNNLFFWLTDYNTSVDILDKTKTNDNFTIFRSALYKSKKLRYEKVLPYFAELEKSENSTLKEPLSLIYKSEPTIGFCGAAGGRWFHRKRRELCEQFKLNKNITTDFIYRNKFCRGKIKNNNLNNWRQEYIDNLYNNLFNFCYRGAGNFSMRFYEVLSAGRIPVLIDSDTELPFEEEIDWHNKIIFAKNVDEAIEKMLDACKNRDLVKMQQGCRKLHEEYFTEEAFQNKILLDS